MNTEVAKEVTILICGLGLIGASLAKTIKKNTAHTVLGWNRTSSVTDKALRDGVIDEGGELEQLIPRADITIFLHVPVEFTKKLREGRNNKFTGKEKQDIHESDVTHLQNATMTGLLAAKMLGWHVIECVKDGDMRTVEDIEEEIYSIVEKTI